MASGLLRNLLDKRSERLLCLVYCMNMKVLSEHKMKNKTTCKTLIEHKILSLFFPHGNCNLTLSLKAFYFHLQFQNTS